MKIQILVSPVLCLIGTMVRLTRPFTYSLTSQWSGVSVLHLSTGPSFNLSCSWSNTFYRFTDPTCRCLTRSLGVASIFAVINWCFLSVSILQWLDRRCRERERKRERDGKREGSSTLVECAIQSKRVPCDWLQGLTVCRTHDASTRPVTWLFVVSRDYLSPVDNDDAVSWSRSCRPRRVTWKLVHNGRYRPLSHESRSVSQTHGAAESRVLHGLPRSVRRRVANCGDVGSKTVNERSGR